MLSEKQTNVIIARKPTQGSVNTLTVQACAACLVLPAHRHTLSPAGQANLHTGRLALIPAHNSTTLSTRIKTDVRVDDSQQFMP
jgi:hypothetical protein